MKSPSTTSKAALQYEVDFSAALSFVLKHGPPLEEEKPFATAVAVPVAPAVAAAPMSLMSEMSAPDRSPRRRVCVRRASRCSTAWLPHA